MVVYLFLFILAVWFGMIVMVYAEDKSRTYRVNKRNKGRRKVHGIF